MRPSDDELAAWRAFLEAHARVVRVLERELRAEKNLPLHWYDALVQLQEAGGALRMHELADRMLLSRSATTRFADRLEAAGLVEREVCEGDRRGLELRLTEEGRRTLADAAGVHLRGVAQHFTAHLDEDEQDVLREALGRVAREEAG